MKKHISILLFFLLINFVIGQTKKSDYYTFSKEDTKHLKPLRYLLLNPKDKDTKIEKEGKIYFKIDQERFVYDKKKHMVDTCPLQFLDKIKLSDSRELKQNEIAYYNSEIKKTAAYKESGFKPPFPIASVHPYFKVLIMEKTANGKLLRYEVDWQYSDF